METHTETVMMAALEKKLGSTFSRKSTLPSPSPLLIVISGPSGVGKDAVINRLREVHGDMHFVVTATTRPRRQGEVDGEDYIFMDKEGFEDLIERNELLNQLFEDPRRVALELLVVVEGVSERSYLMRGALPGKEGAHGSSAGRLGHDVSELRHHPRRPSHAIHASHLALHLGSLVEHADEGALSRIGPTFACGKGICQHFSAV